MKCSQMGLFQLDIEVDQYVSPIFILYISVGNEISFYLYLILNRLMIWEDPIVYFTWFEKSDQLLPNAKIQLYDEYTSFIQLSDDLRGHYNMIVNRKCKKIGNFI